MCSGKAGGCSGSILLLEGALVRREFLASQKEGSWMTRLHRLWKIAYGNVDFTDPDTEEMISVLRNDFVSGGEPEWHWNVHNCYDKICLVEASLGIADELNMISRLRKL